MAGNSNVKFDRNMLTEVLKWKPNRFLFKKKKRIKKKTRLALNDTSKHMFIDLRVQIFT